MKNIERRIKNISQRIPNMMDVIERAVDENENFSWLSRLNVRNIEIYMYIDSGTYSSRYLRVY